MSIARSPRYLPISGTPSPRSLALIWDPHRDSNRSASEVFGVHRCPNTPGGEPLTLGGLSGRVVLIEFWPFPCGNCQRTLPFLRRMHGRYRPGLVLVGVHTPEPTFERPARNVERAARERGLEFRVGLDNGYAAWNAFGSRYWPSLYTIDAAGHVRYAYLGGDGYRRTEATIGALLAEAERASKPTEPNPQPVRSAKYLAKRTQPR